MKSVKKTMSILTALLVSFSLFGITPLSAAADETSDQQTPSENCEGQNEETNAGETDTGSEGSDTKSGETDTESQGSDT